MSLPISGHCRFAFEHDAFDFPNELYWEYQPCSASGKMTTIKRDPPPTYAHHCFVLVRSARQFLYHARFVPEQPVLSGDAYRKLIREVVGRSPRHASIEPERVPIPGYPGLREFSMAHPQELKAECGGAWQSYFLRSHWRMVFPISRRHQAGVADELVESLKSGHAPIVHIFRFPQLTINHGLLLFGHCETADGVAFSVYDPNIPQRPTVLNYSRASREFHLPGNHYWAGGLVNVVHVYRNWIY